MEKIDSMDQVQQIGPNGLRTSVRGIVSKGPLYSRCRHCKNPTPTPERLDNRHTPNRWQRGVPNGVQYYDRETRRLRWFCMELILLKIITHNMNNPIFDEFLSLSIANADFRDDDVEVLFRRVATDLGAGAVASLEIERLRGENDITPVIRAVFRLAKLFGGLYSTLTADQKDELGSAVAELVSFPDNLDLEAAIETLFNGAVNTIAGVKGFTALVDSINPPDITEE